MVTREEFFLCPGLVSGLIPELKEICIDWWLGKYYCILRIIRAKRGVGEQVWFVPNIVGPSWGGGVHNTGKNCNFYSHLSFEIVFHALKLTQNCYKNMIISFSWKLTTPSYKYALLERLSSQSDKIGN